MGVAGLILGIFGFIFSFFGWIPFGDLGFVPFEGFNFNEMVTILTVLGMIFSTVSIPLHFHANKDPGAPITGLVLSILGFNQNLFAGAIADMFYSLF